ncbi:DUF262 domain-containing protein [Clostridiales bacterium FE2011]|nr:DUF262 domain-containing protein [Clostridiales bacterium FE2011]
MEDKILTISDEEIEFEQALDEEIEDNTLMGDDIAVFYNTYNLSTLMKWWNNKLVVPDFQRAYVWTIKKASEFVDSILRGFPIPSIFLYDDKESAHYYIVDGHQRLRSLYYYIEEKKFNGRAFKLTGNIHHNWINKTFDELDYEDQERLKDVLLNITVMRPVAPDQDQSSMYLAFQRLNTGGEKLSAQEIRMAISYGSFANYLHKIANDTRFDKWNFLRTKAQRDNHNFSRIQELILKFFAYYFTYPQKFTGNSTRTMLDNFFSQQKEFDNPRRKKPGIEYHSEAEFDTVFNAALDIVLSLSIEDLSPNTRPTQAFLESIWVGLTYKILHDPKEINTDRLSAYIRNWKATIGEDQFNYLFSPRRASSTQSAYERISEGIRYFSGEF